MRRSELWRFSGLGGALVLAMALPIVSAPVAAAAPGPVYGTFSELTGVGGAYRGTMTLAPGFPAATFTTTSASGSGIGLQSGSSTWLPAGSPPGAAYGSSQNQTYLNLRPAQNDAASPSVTTYTFARPTPASGWSFVLGDIDADQVRVTATAADGSAVPVAALGFAGVFNYCDASPRSSSCSGFSAPYDLPGWDPTTATLTGNSGATDTTGAAGWFTPTAPIKTLTFSYRWRSGLPVYQTWFATQTRAVTGTVTAGGSGLAGVTVEILDGGGAVVGTVTTGADGSYGRDGLAPGTYTVRVVTPDGYAPVGPSRRPADLSAGDATTVDFALAQVADLSVIKKLDTDPVVAGEPITYTLTATNAGPADATGVSVVDTVPPGLTGVSGQVTGGVACVVDAALLTCPVGALIVGASATVQVTGTVSATAPAGVALLNQAAVTGDQPDVDLGNNRASAAARVTTSADLELVKTFTPDNPVAGGAVSYQLTVTNNGPSRATGLAISDPLDPGVTVGDVTTTAGTCEVTDGVVGCRVPALDVGDSVTVTVPITLPTGAAPVLQNTASVTAATPDPDLTNNTGGVEFEPSRQSDLALIKTASPATATPGQSIEYQLAVFNAGPSDAPNVLLTDSIPLGLDAVTVTDAGGANCTVTDQVSCSWASVPVEATRTVTLTGIVAPDAPDGALTNTAAVTAPVDESDPSDNTATTSVLITSAADVSLTKTAGPDPLAPGGTVTFTLTVGNAGPQQSALLELRDPIPAGLSITAVDDPDCLTDAVAVTCLIAGLDPEASRTVTITGTLSPDYDGDELTNTAQVASLLTVDPDPADNSATATVAVITPEPPGSNLTVTKTATTPTVDQGDPAGFVVTVTNQGPADQTDVVVADTADDGLAITSATGSTGTWDGAAGLWTVPSLAAGASATLTVSATATAVGTLTNTATLISSGRPDTDPADNSASATVQVNPTADLALTKSVTPAGGAPGQPVTYQLTATNAGPSPASGVHVVDTLPPGVSGPSESGSVECTISGQTVDCTLGDFPVGATATITIGAVVTAGATGTIVNTATISSDTSDPNPADNTASATFTVSGVSPTTPTNPPPSTPIQPVTPIYPTYPAALASTGAPIDQQAVVAGLLVSLGAFLVIVAGRRHPQRRRG